MTYFYLKQEAVSPTWRIYAAPRNLECKAVPWPYEAMYCEKGSFFYDKMQWLEENAPLFVVSEMRGHRGGRIFGSPQYEIWIDDEDVAIQFKLTFCS